jgi:hypothetical protein
MRYLRDGQILTESWRQTERSLSWTRRCAETFRLSLVFPTFRLSLVFPSLVFPWFSPLVFPGSIAKAWRARRARRCSWSFPRRRPIRPVP